MPRWFERFKTGFNEARFLMVAAPHGTTRARSALVPDGNDFPRPVAGVMRPVVI